MGVDKAVDKAAMQKAGKVGPKHSPPEEARHSSPPESGKGGAEVVDKAASHAHPPDSDTSPDVVGKPHNLASLGALRAQIPTVVDEVEKGRGVEAGVEKAVAVVDKAEAAGKGVAQAHRPRRSSARRPSAST